MQSEKAAVVDGALVPANGYMVIEPTKQESQIIVIGDLGFKSGVVISVSADESEDISPAMDATDYDWKPGDLVYFKESIEVDKQTLVHWTDVVAYRRFV